MDLATLTANSIDDCWNRIGVRGNKSCVELERHIHCRNCPTYASAASGLLDRGLPADHLAEWTAHFARPKAAENTSVFSVVIFRVGNEWLALPTTIFHEIAALRPIYSLP